MHITSLPQRLPCLDENPCHPISTHDDVIKWKHFPRYWPFVRGDLPITGGLPSQRPVTRGFDVFFDRHPNKQLGKQSGRRLFETSSRSLWRYCNVLESNSIMLVPIHSKSDHEISSRNGTRKHLDILQNVCANNHIIADETTNKMICFEWS